MAIDTNICRLNDINSIDVPLTVQQIRSQRHGSVQNIDQYLFIYEALAIYPENATSLG